MKRRLRRREGEVEKEKEEKSPALSGVKLKRRI